MKTDLIPRVIFSVVIAPVDVDIALKPRSKYNKPVSLNTLPPTPAPMMGYRTVADLWQRY